MRHAYGRQVSLPDVAARANLSPFHFLRVYKRAYGETPHEFLAELTPGPMFDAETAEGIRSLVERGPLASASSRPTTSRVTTSA